MCLPKVIPFTDNRYSADEYELYDCLHGKSVPLPFELEIKGYTVAPLKITITPEWLKVFYFDNYGRFIIRPQQLDFVPVDAGNVSFIYRDFVELPGLSFPDPFDKNKEIQSVAVAGYPNLAVSANTGRVYDVQSRELIFVSEDGQLAGVHYHVPTHELHTVNVQELIARSKPYEEQRDYRRLELSAPRGDWNLCDFAFKKDEDVERPDLHRPKLQTVYDNSAILEKVNHMESLINKMFEGIGAPASKKLIQSPLLELSLGNDDLTETISDGRICVWRGETFVGGFATGPYHYVTTDEDGRPLKPEYCESIHDLVEELEVDLDLPAFSQAIYELSNDIGVADELLEDLDYLKKMRVPVKGIHPVYVVSDAQISQFRKIVDSYHPAPKSKKKKK
ncbi:hypothetical protein [Vibrio phage vB_VmeM-Yong XC32]|nr:hypothetical protein [Vibrio phage vB_VmeM-Yong XC31]QAX96366.1 hypothetical protein [Vibrio phage vB_VmeM-Yong XC32]QAX96684.1 hypothetical protein [Vibrio phage vB_VmeM-Yong MS31]QAX97002.1 hypothetical protein [Vibrio phage vB_VmeM-Yong MS32]